VIYRVLADAIVLAHGAFVLFVVSGGLLVLRWRRVAWVHVPSAAWGFLVEVGGWECPLTPLENWLWARSGASGYASGFVEHYLVPVLYPEGLTPELQLGLGGLVFAVNVLVYWKVIRRGRASCRVP